MENKVLRDRAMRRDRRMGGDSRRDMRNPYGSRGGYVDSRRGSDYNMGTRYDGAESYSGDYRGYDSRYDYADGHYPMERHREHYGPRAFLMHGVTGMYPYPTMDYIGYDYAKEQETYKKDLEEWVHKLKKKDRFGWDKHQVIEAARQMGVSFEHFDELEFYAIYLAMVTDYPKVANEPRFYVSLAKDFFDDDDTAKRYSEKVCAYLYYIVLGESE